jgi:hypothetical protein
MGANCAKVEETPLEQVISRQNLTTYSKQMIALFQGDVFLIVLDSDWFEMWSFASSPGIGAEFKGQLNQIQSAVTSTEQTIKHLNEGWRVEELSSFRLTCLSSRIWVWILNETNHVIVVHRFRDEDARAEEPPDLPQKATDLCMKIKDSIPSLNNEQIQ